MVHIHVLFEPWDRIILHYDMYHALRYIIDCIVILFVVTTYFRIMYYIIVFFITL
jgi:hypothetical protein